MSYPGVVRENLVSLGDRLLWGMQEYAHDPHDVASYIIWSDGLTPATYYAKNGITGQIEFSGVDAATVIQAAVDALTSGGKLSIRIGIYDLGTTTLNINQHAIEIEGEKSDIAGNRGTILTYSGTGNAIRVYLINVRLMKTRIRHLDVVAQGNAVSAAGGRGIQLYNVEDAILEDVTIRDFEAGTGISVFCDDTSYCAQVVIRESYTYNCKYGLFSDGNSAGHRINTLQIMNTVFIGKAGPTAGSMGINLDADTIGALVLGGDVETFEKGFYIGGDYNSLIKTRTEFTTTHIQFVGGGDHNAVLNHFFVGAGTYVTNAGTGNMFHYNPNYVTENSGTATITAAQTSIVVAHGCDYTPSALDTSVVLTNLPTTDIGDVYVDTFDATNFTIHCRNVPGVATAIFNWAVRRTP